MSNEEKNTCWINFFWSFSTLIFISYLSFFRRFRVSLVAPISLWKKNFSLSFLLLHPKRINEIETFGNEKTKKQKLRKTSITTCRKIILDIELTFFSLKLKWEKFSERKKNILRFRAYNGLTVQERTTRQKKIY